MNAQRSDVRDALLGLLALSLVIGGAGLTFAIYRKTFDPGTRIVVVVNQAEDQLDLQADVKVRGVRVGEIRDIRRSPDGSVRLMVALDRGAARDVPADVKARILPKTLFGERYLDLVPTSAKDPGPISAGAVVRQDTSQRTAALQQVFDDLYPVLKSVDPAELNMALSAVATAVRGRGEQIGRTIDSLAVYESRIQSVLPDLAPDLALLADVTARYGDAAPALLAATRNLTVTSATIEDKQHVLRTVLQDTYGLSSRLRVLVAQNGDRMVHLAHTARPTLALLARYSPEYGCVFNGAKIAIKRIYDVFGGDDGPFVIRGKLRIAQTRGVYSPSMAPNGALQKKLLRDLASYGPSCPIINTNPTGGTPNVAIPIPALALIGTYQGPLGLPATPLDTGVRQENQIAQGNFPGLGDPSGSPDDQQAVEDAAGALTGHDTSQSNPILNLLFGPLVRGNNVGGAQ
jgi:virulence factor Mce-like protein